MAEKDHRLASDMPTQFGPTAAVSSSNDHLRPDLSHPDSATIADVKTPAGSNLASSRPVRDESPRPGASRPGAFVPEQDELDPGTVLARRYEIISLLGVGGMGSVYRARDLELNREVALKVIRPELARIPGIVDRFKQELRLSHQVTHRNVVRLYDLAEDAGLRFVTMEVVPGRDLRSILLDRGKLPADEAVDILQQIGCALQAAHRVGILHRDLKPQNIMLEDSGRVVVMDFGLARTIEGDGMTQSGALVGTMEYMSPEQALGKDLDQRSDIYALGLIGYEMLTGNMPFRADSAIASLLRRTRESAAPCSSVDNTIPGALSAIIARCLECDLERRYTDTEDILRDLESWRDKTAAASLKFEANLPSTSISGRWMFAIGGLSLAIVLAIAVPLAIRHFAKPSTGTPAAAAPSASLAIMPFYNASSNSSQDWLGSSIAEMLGSDIGQSARMRMVSPDRLQQVLEDLHLSASTPVDAPTVRRVAEFTSAQTVIYGRYTAAGTQIHVDATVLDLAHGSRSTASADIAQESDLIPAINKLAGELRDKLVADPKLLEDLKAHTLRPDTTSVEALRAYEDGEKLARSGDHIQAQDQYFAATNADPNFAMAFAKLADTYASLGHDDLAQRASRTAVELSDALPAQERYLIEAGNARINNQPDKAIAAYLQLATANPADTDVQFALAGLYEQAGNYTAALQHLAAVLTSDPKNVEALLASGRVDILSGNPQAGLEFLSKALNLAVELGNQEEKAKILQATGIAYSSLNRPDDALNEFQQSLAIKKQIGDKRGAAASLEEIGSIQDSQGHPDQALPTYQQALAIRREIGDQSGIGNALMYIGSFYHNHGKPADALQYFSNALEIERTIGDTSRQALCLNNIGTVKSDQGAYQDALTYLDQGYELRQKLNVPEDIGESQHNLAEVSANLGQFDAALGFYLKAMDTFRNVNDQHGMAMESNGMAKIFAAQGRYGAALGAMKTALDSIRQTKETTSLAVEVVGGWGHLLAEVGRAQEGQASLDEALNTAHQIRDDASVALATNWIGDAHYYQGDYAGARQQYDHALTLALTTSDKDTILLSRVNRAKADLALGHAAAVIPVFRKLAQDADALGMKSVSVECAVDLAQASLAANDYRDAEQNLTLTLARVENLGLKLLEARAQFLQASALDATGKTAQSLPSYRDALRTLQGLSKEDGASKILDRPDLQAIVSNAEKALPGGH